VTCAPGAKSAIYDRLVEFNNMKVGSPFQKLQVRYWNYIIQTERDQTLRKGVNTNLFARTVRLNNRRQLKHSLIKILEFCNISRHSEVFIE